MDNGQSGRHTRHVLEHVEGDSKREHEPVLIRFTLEEENLVRVQIPNHESVTKMLVQVRIFQLLTWRCFS